MLECQSYIYNLLPINNSKNTTDFIREQRWYYYQVLSAVINAEKKDKNKKDEYNGTEGRRTQNKNVNQTIL